MKKIGSIFMLLFTLGCLYFMSKGVVGITLSYVLIIFHIVRLLAEIVAVSTLTPKLTKIPEKFREEIPRKFSHIMACLITLPMIYHAFKGTIHVLLSSLFVIITVIVMYKTGYFEKNTKRESSEDNLQAGALMFGGFVFNFIISYFVPEYSMGVLLGVLTLGLGDPAACFIGKAFGKHKFHNNKSVEGFIGFILIAAIGMFLFTHITIWKLLILSTVGAIAELYSGDKDNLLIQLAVALMAFIIL